jgi:aromatic-L-amino-acid/L-tryptophan decarboxylase
VSTGTGTGMERPSPDAAAVEELVAGIRRLEPVSRRLDPGPEERRPFRDAALDYGESFLAGLDQAKAYRADASAARTLRDLPIGEEPARPGTLLALLGRAVDGPGINPASGGHLGYIPGGGLYYAAVGDYLAALTNRYAGVRFASPGATEMEDLLLAWMAGLVGYPGSSGGYLASGGSLANLAAIVTARHARGLKARDYARAVVYLTRHAHHCVDKALRVAGMGESVRRYVAMDGGYRMRADALDSAVAEDRAAGLVPWLVVASAGTTDVGAIDPLPAIADVCDREGLWLHVDAAYGGFFALVDEVRPRLAGIERSDSVVLDPHKGLFLPYGTGAVLVRDRRAMFEAHAYEAAYMQDALTSDALDALSPADLSPELSRHFRGLRLWLPLQLHGLAPFRACLEEKLLLTRYFHRRVAELGYETGPAPELSVATFRWSAADDPEEANRAILSRIHDDGRVFISSTRLDGRFTLRLAALAFRTRLSTVDTLLDLLGGGPGRGRA